MSENYLLPILLLGLSLLIGVGAECNNGGGDDDDDDVDDDAVTLDCESAYHYLYEECGITLTGDNLEPIDVETLVTWCESNEDQYAAYREEIFNCIRDHYGRCEEVQACFDSLPQ